MDEDFEWDVWVDQTSRIPQVHIGDALRAVVDRKKAIDQEPQIIAQEIATAAQYHEAVAGSAEQVDGVPVWVAPVANFAAYPPGVQVHDAGQVWVQVSDRITHERPGEGGAWAPHVPEPEDQGEEVSDERTTD